MNGSVQELRHLGWRAFQINMFVNCITSTFELLRIAIKKKVAHFNIPGVPLLRHKYNSNDFHVVRHVTMGGVKEIIYSSVYIDKA